MAGAAAAAAAGSALDRPADTAEASLLRAAFHRRATEAIARATRVATPAALAEALSAPTDAGAVARLLSATVGQDATATLDPVAEAIARGTEIKQRLIKEAGGLLTASQMGAALGGISRQAVDKRRRAGQLLAMRVGADWRYPAIQVGRNGMVPDGLAMVLRCMTDAGPWSILDFLITPDDVLEGLTPLAALRRGGSLAATVQRQLAAAAVDAYG
jgi:hypothetical protein